MLRPARCQPKVSAYAYLNGPHNFAATPLASACTKIIIHMKPEQRSSWAYHGKVGWCCDNNLLSCVHSLFVDLPEMGVVHLKSAQHALAYFSHTLSMRSLTSHAFSICLSYMSMLNLRISLNLCSHHHNTMIQHQLCTSMQLEEFSW